MKSTFLPELIGRWFTKQQSASESVPPVNQTIPDHGSTPTIADTSSTTDDTILWCYCHKDDLADDMICCDNDNCLLNWYHYSCVGLSYEDIPDGDWYCPECR